MNVNVTLRGEGTCLWSALYYKQKLMAQELGRLPMRCTYQNKAALNDPLYKSTYQCCLTARDMLCNISDRYKAILQNTFCRVCEGIT